MNRGKRVAQYQVASQIADKHAVSGELELALSLLREHRDRAAATMDEDYRLFFEGELLHYEQQDYPAQLALLQQALAWQNDHGEGKDSFLICQKAVCLSLLDRRDEAITLYDQALAINPKDYNALRNKAATFAEKGKGDEAIALYDQALAINPKDYNALRNKGVALSRQGKEDDAIALYDQVLAINPKDYHALRQKGVSLSEQDKENEAIALYGQALAISPKDYHALRQKGVSLSRQGKIDEAIVCFKQAIEIQGDDADSYRDWAVGLYNNGIRDGVFENIRQAARIKPDKFKDDFFVLARLLDKDAKAEWEGLSAEIERHFSPSPLGQQSSVVLQGTVDSDPLSDIRGFVAKIRTELDDRGQELLTEIQKANERVADFLTPKTKRDQERSEFLVLRKWNSYTPAIPAGVEDNRSRGGGYFIYHQGKGIVIDPGYNFIENFHEANGRVHDIDAIVITHAHNDHTTDFESLCTLLYKYNKDIKDQSRKKRISLYLNNGAFKKFSGILNLQDHSYIDKVYTLNRGNNYTLPSGVGLMVLPAFHDEIVSRDQSVGLLFSIPIGDGDMRKLLFTSDTGLFPLKLEDTKFVPNTDGTDELWQEYPDAARNGVDVLVTHIGSVNKNEIVVDLNKGVHECLYPNHLGVIGVCRMITKLRSRLAIVSEFGEELRSSRCFLVRQIDRIVKEVLRGAEDPPPAVLPGDLAFRYDIGAHKVCCENGEWIDCEDVRYLYKDTSRKEDILYLSREAADRL